MSARKVPVTIVTGFLGAGKTTLVRHAIETAEGRRLALIVNEFGDVGVDGTILRSCGIKNCPEENIVELTNGCICCTVADDFIPTLETLLSRQPAPEHIIIETSGLALPKPLVKAFEWPDIRNRVTVDGVVTVVDGPAVKAGRFVDDPEKVAAQRAADPSVDHENPLEEVYEDQLLCADLVVLNKADLLSDDDIKTLSDEIKRSIPRAIKIVAAREGQVPAGVLLGLSAAAEDDLAARPSHHDNEAEHDHDDFETFIVDVPEVATPDDLASRAKAIANAHDVLRVKGYAAIGGKPMRLLLQGVGERVDTRYERAWQPDEARVGRLVVIGQKGLDRDAIVRTLTGES
ncbi:cobalamin biosynthesis protein CobW [Hyphomicrobium denitrificans ATCC 51888]|uniref:Cobalamin biosynthesis protein CobW n=1 Tax=Hyphomicrobium denitrificans (strain ATCC 51888 / DSM 1869 / NCIMB 11706 / TK 0415) TaxID=582899 RepID=D8JTU8_HYPDA|nr:cobalamin biosynthesis protein CobW [Hyphomicrobium denitrificans]ADJ24496.1 cobalamin biosynthesis protein CobW [Hyphomicrobium denitrificans ATCC 51888]